MRSRRGSRAGAAARWSWRAAMVTGALAAVSGSGCATDPPPRPAQIDPSNPGAPESRPLEVAAGPPVEVSPEVRSGAPPPDGGIDDGARPQAQPEQEHQGQQPQQEKAPPPQQHPEHHHEPG